MDLKKLLVQKGFTKKHYQDQNLRFWSIKYQGNMVQQFIEKFYDQNDIGQEEDIEYRANEIGFVVEIQEDLQTSPQWTFIGGLEKFHEFKSVQEFIEFVDSLPGKDDSV
ncbi:hypothetical protein [Bacillus safensis]|uniref:hypothetical protein n=1 Tax=Bacillus safensis TaxID=561879 RepID=UPI001C2409EE|nr:hypothetical protein [Bacillus safensis]MBU8855275.1 hypothetical protein [Bacillus sp. FJAT-26377]MED1461441.1 hypothetical protein [Bacillus safensis]